MGMDLPEFPIHVHHQELIRRHCRQLFLSSTKVAKISRNFASNIIVQMIELGRILQHINLRLSFVRRVVVSELTSRRSCLSTI
jgi:hypothetical protein